MNRRTWAGLAAAFLVIALAVVGALRPVPYVTFSPGPTVNVLGKFDDKPIIEVEGRKSYEDKGSLRLLTVVPSGPESKVSLAELVLAWADPDRSVYPYNAVYGETDTRKSVRQESTAQMASSQDVAVAAALGALDIPYETFTRIVGVEKSGPAAGKLKAGDRVLEVNGKRIGTYEQLGAAIRPLPVGTRVTVAVRREGKKVTLRMRTTKSPADAKASALLVTVGPQYEFPFDVKLNIDENIGGPSGGLMFSMGIYDVLTPGSLTGGNIIAGTGEIDDTGKVGAIGGIQQKLVAAEDVGAKLFFAPADNCAEALAGNFDPKKMRLVKATTLDQALANVEAWVEDPKAELPRCTR